MEAVGTVFPTLLESGNTREQGGAMLAHHPADVQRHLHYARERTIGWISGRWQ
jgi:hypothetical protein